MPFVPGSCIVVLQDKKAHKNELRSKVAADMHAYKHPSFLLSAFRRCSQAVHDVLNPEQRAHIAAQKQLLEEAEASSPEEHQRLLGTFKTWCDENISKEQKIAMVQKIADYKTEERLVASWTEGLQQRAKHEERKILMTILTESQLWQYNRMLSMEAEEGVDEMQLSAMSKERENWIRKNLSSEQYADFQSRYTKTIKEMEDEVRDKAAAMDDDGSDSSSADEIEYSLAMDALASAGELQEITASMDADL